MKQAKIMNVYSITEKLSSTEGLTPNGKWVLYITRKALTPHYEFQLTEVKKLFEKYEAEQDREKGTFNFKTPEDAQSFKEEYDELDNLDVELDLNMQHAKLSDIPAITVQQIEALEEFIEFTPE